ncbi:MAG: histidine phosphatase family protein [Candidatus Binataceae bacterium]
MGRLILVRHAESEGNRDRRFTTSSAVPITALGRQQARTAALRILKSFRPVIVVASPFARALQTATIIADVLGLPVELEHDFREQSFGDLAGKPYDVVSLESTYEPERAWEWTPPGGESARQVLERTAPALDRVARRYAGDDVVLVSHGAVMRTLWAHVTGDWTNAHAPRNCGIVLVEHTAGRYSPPEILDD